MTDEHRRQIEKVVVVISPGVMVVATPIPSDCCATEGVVIACDNGVDLVECWVCGARWTEACEPIEEGARA